MRERERKSGAISGKEVKKTPTGKGMGLPRGKKKKKPKMGEGEVAILSVGENERNAGDWRMGEKTEEGEEKEEDPPNHQKRREISRGENPTIGSPKRKCRRAFAEGKNRVFHLLGGRFLQGTILKRKKMRQNSEEGLEGGRIC